MHPQTIQVGDRIRLPAIDFTGRVRSIVPVADPVVVLIADGGATLTMRASKIAAERARLIGHKPLCAAVVGKPCDCGGVWR